MKIEKETYFTSDPEARMFIVGKIRQARPYADYISYSHTAHKSNFACRLHENPHLAHLNSKLVGAWLLTKYLVDQQETHFVN